MLCLTSVAKTGVQSHMPMSSSSGIQAASNPKVTAAGIRVSAVRSLRQLPNASSPTPMHEPIVLALDVLWYRVCWVIVLLLHGVCVVYLVSLGVLYRYVSHPYLTYFADLLAPANDRHFNAMAAAIFIIASGHLLCLVEMVVASMAKRELILTWSRTVPSSANSQSYEFSPLRQHLRSLQDMTAVVPSSSRFGSALTSGGKELSRSIWRSVFSRHGLLGIESVHFDTVFIMREIVEIGLQTYQAYRTSQMITRPWINTIFVTLVVLNCWSTPIWQVSLRRAPALCRLCCITTDIVLNVGTNMAIPWMIFRSYIAAYDADQFSFELSHLYDDIWFTNLVMENRLLFAVSSLDFLSKFVPHVTILGCLVACKSLLAKMTASPSQVTHGAPQAQQLVVISTKRVDWKTKAVYTLLFTWGATVLVFHQHAARLADSRSELSGCKQFIRPWFVTNIACAMYEHNCYRVPPDKLPLAHALRLIHPNTLLSLVVSHCEELVMPTELQLFPKLLSLELYNVTLRDWSADAAVSASIHTSLVALLLIHVNMTGLPDGVLGPLPDSLTDVEIAYTNLTSLPDDLHARWHAMSVLYLEFSAMRHFPATLAQLEIYDLSLIGNRIESVEPLASVAFASFFLALSHNPIRQLPATIHSDAVFGFLALEDTALETLPAWVSDASAVESLVYAKDSPVCATPTDATTSPLLTCEQADPRGNGRYPLDIMAPRRVP